MDRGTSYQPQVGYFDHVFAVVDIGTAEEIANSDFLRGFGRFEVGTTVADGESWTGRYLFGRRTYVELFGPGDVEGPDAQVGAIGLGLATRSRGGLDVIADRMATLGSRAERGRRMHQEDQDLVPWFDYLDATGSSPLFSAWAMEDLMSPNDLEIRESKYRDWTGPQREAAIGRTGPFISDISLVQLAASADDVATVEPLLRAAGFEVGRTVKVLSAQDEDATIELHTATGDTAGIRQIEFTLAAAAPVAHVEVIGQSRLAVGAGDRAVWDFSRPNSPRRA